MLDLAEFELGLRNNGEKMDIAMICFICDIYCN